jgi:hypothetical protein
MITGGVYEEEACMRRIASRQLLKSASEMCKSRNCKKICYLIQMAQKTEAKTWYEKLSKFVETGLG